MGFLFSPFQQLGRGCLFTLGGCFGLIIVLIIIGIVLGVITDYYDLPP